MYHNPQEDGTWAKDNTQKAELFAVADKQLPKTNNRDNSQLKPFTLKSSKQNCQKNKL